MSDNSGCVYVCTMRPNPMRERFAESKPALGCWLSAPSSVAAEFVGPIGFDYVCIDMQHGLVGYSDLIPMLQALSLSNTTATVRVPWNEPGIIGRALDAGAMAVIVPMVNNAEEAETAVRRGKYPPRGDRSSGPTRVMPLEGPEYAEVANDHVLIIPMIETVEALENLDEILSVDGVDAIYVGPMDLGVSMGLGRGTTDPKFFDALDLISERCRAHGVIAGIHATPGVTVERISRGYGMVTVHSDLLAMTSSLTQSLAKCRGEDGGESDPDAIY